ncbi:MAG TPA: PmoA family protein [Prolixibacteraceae bacterium]|nr:PmoA family protein [Prolixibacteraceae bacterium]HOR99408.1 PmoA family protein [Prolixibacteraceae bacterium]HOS89866.1 PmoA family protein [Prolixibacteraceae bacterium]HPL44551.1 PmoA family protein [Prolixibacteraceae bacterium]HQE51018.1 PmoA family protein [Prolixibacteraceae bacterium]
MAIKRVSSVISFLLILLLGTEVSALDPLKVELKEDAAAKKVEVFVDGKLFTAYIFSEGLSKPVLWPVISPAGNSVTRGYPLAPVAGDRVDHPHHVGVWFNYGDVNGLDFWNNSGVIAADKAAAYGTIRHRNLEKIKNGRKDAEMRVSNEWVDSGGNKILDEKTTFRFLANEKLRIIDRTTTLTAVSSDVRFPDNKEGLYAIRVSTELELPMSGSVEVTDQEGRVGWVPAADRSAVSGNYLGSNGLSGADVWGTRGKWMKLSGTINGEAVSVMIIDHPSNPGYPAYWHARGYGLFAVNNLGQKALSGGKNELNFSLNQGKSVTFRYRLLVSSGELTTGQINKLVKSFVCCRKSKLISKEW